MLELKNQISKSLSQVKRGNNPSPIKGNQYKIKKIKAIPNALNKQLLKKIEGRPSCGICIYVISLLSILVARSSAGRPKEKFVIVFFFSKQVLSLYWFQFWGRQVRLEVCGWKLADRYSKGLFGVEEWRKLLVTLVSHWSGNRATVISDNKVLLCWDLYSHTAFQHPICECRPAFSQLACQNMLAIHWSCFSIKCLSFWMNFYTVSGSRTTCGIHAYTRLTSPSSVAVFQSLQG